VCLHLSHLNNQLFNRAFSPRASLVLSHLGNRRHNLLCSLLVCLALSQLVLQHHSHPVVPPDNHLRNLVHNLQLNQVHNQPRSLLLNLLCNLRPSPLDSLLLSRPFNRLITQPVSPPDNLHLCLPCNLLRNPRERHRVSLLLSLLDNRVEDQHLNQRGRLQFSLILVPLLLLVLNPLPCRPVSLVRDLRANLRLSRPLSRPDNQRRVLLIFQPRSRQEVQQPNPHRHRALSPVPNQHRNRRDNLRLNQALNQLHSPAGCRLLNLSRVLHLNHPLNQHLRQVQLPQGSLPLVPQCSQPSNLPRHLHLSLPGSLPHNQVYNQRLSLHHNRPDNQAPSPVESQPCNQLDCQHHSRRHNHLIALHRSRPCNRQDFQLLSLLEYLAQSPHLSHH
jgi:hypothetical protein